MALALITGVGLILVGNLAERVSAPGAMRLVVFDTVVAEGAPVRPYAYLEDLDTLKPAAGVWLVSRMPDGSIQPLYTNGRGVAIGDPQSRLPAGRSEIVVGFPETHPRIDVQAKGGAWVLPRQTRVVWIDAAAVLSPDQLEGASGPVAPADAEAIDVALTAIKTIAARRQPVYLVAVKPEHYGAVRRRLESMDLPQGPAIWLREGDELGLLSILSKASTSVDAALVGSDRVEKAAARVIGTVRRVPVAGSTGPAPRGRVMPWREVVEQLSAQERTWRGAGDGK
jgi:hypothetical protein